MENEDYTLLVVDDSSIIRDILCFQIDELGYNVDSAENGAEGLEMMKKEDVWLVGTDFSTEVTDVYGFAGLADLIVDRLRRALAITVDQAMRTLAGFTG